MTNTNMDADHYVWIGEDGSLDPYKLLEERGFEQEGALRLILAAIVDAHPAGKPSRAQRIDNAESALLGAESRSGVDEKDDERILRRIARGYAAAWFMNQSAEPPFAPIAREALEWFEKTERHKEHHVDNAVRRLQRKFKRDRLWLLARATASLKWDLPEFHTKLLRILTAMQALGIQVDLTDLLRRIDPAYEKPPE